MPKLSVVIPTLQKNKEFLVNLINSVAREDVVGEIILIDNSLQGLDMDCNKLRVITPLENLYVNPSWNLGVKESKFEIIALLNDDITIPSEFCTNVVNKMTLEMGIVGMDTDLITTSSEMEAPPENTEIELLPVKDRSLYFGVAMFFYKDAYVEIPNELKIYCGDDWIVKQAKKNKKQIYNICGQKIYHYGSMSSKEKKLNPIGDRDRKLYRKLTRHWWQFIFNIESVYRGIRFTIFGIEILCHFDKKH